MRAPTTASSLALATSRKRASGTLELLGPHSFMGNFSVTGGALQLTGATLRGGFLLDTGTSLTGFGSLTNEAAGSSSIFRGSVTPSGGNLTVDQASFESASVLAFTVEEGVTPDRVIVEAGGSVNSVAGARIDLTIGPGDYSAPGGVNFILIDGMAGATVTNNFGLSDNFEFVDVTFDPGAGPEDLAVNVEGSITEADLLAAAETPNQTAVAGALANVIENPPPGSSAEMVRNAFFGIPEGEAAPLYDDLGAESIAAFSRAALATAQRFERGLHRRVRDLAWGSREAYSGFGVQPGVPGAPLSGLRIDPALGLYNLQPLDGVRPAPGMGAWMDGWGQIGSVDGDGNSNDTDTNLAGVSLGIDARLGESGLIGGAIGYTYADLEVDGQNTRSNAHGLQTAIYGGLTTPRWYLSGAGRFAWADNENERKLVVGTLRGTSDGEFDTLAYGIGIEGGANITRVGLVVVQGLASFDWTTVEREDFNESGGGALSALNLAVDDESIDSIRTGLGFRASLRYPLDEESEMVPELRVRWFHDFGDDERLVNAPLPGCEHRAGTLRGRGSRGRSRQLPAGPGLVRLAGRPRARLRQLRRHPGFRSRGARVRHRGPGPVLDGCSKTKSWSPG